MIDETRDECLQELERINKEIETVKHEVEQEQRRLSRYQTVQADGRKTVLMSVSNSRDSHGLPSCKDLPKTYSRAKKYVVDNSKPRTDLEYDPLSNFSADLRSCSSSGKEQKVKNGQSLKRRNVVHSTQKTSVTQQAQLSRSPSPELLENSNDDRILIIDIPPSPDRKRGRCQKHCVPYTRQDTVKELKEIQQAPILRESPPLRLANAEVFKVTSPPASTVEVNRVYSTENYQDPSNLHQNKECENIAFDGSVIDLTGCLEDLGGECQKICFQAAETEVVESPQPASPPAAADEQDHSWKHSEVKEEENTFCAELHQCELPCGVEKMNPLQPHHYPHKNSLFYKTSDASSYSPYKQHTKQAQKTEQLAQYTAQKALNKMPGQMQGKAEIHHASPDSYLEQAEPASGSSQCQARYISEAPVNLHLTNKAESSSASSEQLLVKADNGEVIIIVSSSDEEEELNYSEVELSDSDPMEECYRIFMEANNAEKGNEEQPDVSVSMLSTLQD